MVCGLLITVASLTADQSLGTWASVAAACGLFICSSQALEVKLGSSAHGNFCCVPWEDRGWNVCPLHWWVDSYPLYHQGNPGSSVLSLSLSLSTVSLLLNSVSGELWLWPSCDHPQLWACIFPPFVLTRKSKGFSHNWGTKILGFIPLDPNLVSCPSLSQSKRPGGQKDADCSQGEMWISKWCMQHPLHSPPPTRAHGFCRGKMLFSSEEWIDINCVKGENCTESFPYFFSNRFSPLNFLLLKIVKHRESCKNSKMNTGHQPFRLNNC